MVVVVLLVQFQNLTLNGGKNLKDKSKKIKVYVLLNNDLKTITTYKSLSGTAKSAKMNKIINNEFQRRKNEDKSQRNEFDRHIEHLQLTECQINIRAVHKAPSMEEMLLEKEGEREIIRKIWDLPIPQNRRVYMFIVDEFSLTEIARIEKRDVSVIKRSVDAGIRKLQKNLKNF